MNQKNQKILLRTLYTFFILGVSALAAYHMLVGFGLGLSSNPNPSATGAHNVRETVIILFTLVIIPALLVKSEMINYKLKQQASTTASTIQQLDSRSMSGLRIALISIITVVALPIIVFVFAIAWIIAYFAALQWILFPFLT